MQDSKTAISTHWLEKSLAVLGAAACLIITTMIWRSVSSYQTMWPLPAIYFLELMVLSLFSAFLFIRGHPFQGYVVWGMVGVLITFIVLGSLSVGFCFLPVALIFALLALIWDIRNRQPIALHLGICGIAVLIQAALMFAAIGLSSLGIMY
jgi:hypothetical protein